MDWVNLVLSRPAHSSGVFVNGAAAGNLPSASSGRPRGIDDRQASGSATSITRGRRVSSLWLIMITVVPYYLETSLRHTEEHDVSVGEAGNVSIGDLHIKVA
jgi:phage head maturation protease